jgi:hypothetical protein
MQGGKVARGVKCDGGRVALTAGQRTSERPPSLTGNHPLTLYGLSPVVEATGGAAH